MGRGSEVSEEGRRSKASRVLGVVEGTVDSGIDEKGDPERVDNILPTWDEAIVYSSRFTKFIKFRVLECHVILFYMHS